MPTKRLDLAFPTPRSSDPKKWRGLRTLFLSQRPRHVGPGDRVWLRHRESFIYSYEIQSIFESEERVSDIDDSDFGPGPSILLRRGSGRVETKALSAVGDPDGVGASWGRGLRYLTPGATRFVQVGGYRAQTRRLGRLIPPDHGTTESTEVITKARARTIDRKEARLTKDYLAWMNNSDLLQSLAIPIGSRGEIRADLYHPDADTLIEAKASAGRHHMRLAVGQLFDYVRHAPPVVGSIPALAVLVPAKPTGDLVDFLASVEVGIIWRLGKRFVDSRDGELTTPF